MRLPRTKKKTLNVQNRGYHWKWLFPAQISLKWEKLTSHLTFFPLAVVLFSTGVGERSSGQSHVNSGSRHTSSVSNTFTFSLSGSNTCRVCLPGATNGTVLFRVLLLYNCCIKWNKSLLYVVITPVLSHVSKHSFYVLFECNCVFLVWCHCS